MEILTKENLVGAKKLPLQFPGLSFLSKENQVSLVRALLSEPGSEVKSADLGGWGGGQMILILGPGKQNTASSLGLTVHWTLSGPSVGGVF